MTRFTGSSSGSAHSYSTDYFTCDHPEWRIEWSYTPNSTYPDLAIFTVYIYPKNEVSSIGAITQYGNTTTNGTTYIDNRQGEFNLKFFVSNLEGYTAIIEQDVDSVPEFSPMILLSPLTTGIVVAMALARGRRRALRISL